MSNAFRSARLFLISLLVFPVVAMATTCDVDGDNDVDRADIRLIFAARNMPATGPDDPRDANGDGTITVRDGRACLAQCTLPRCAEPPSNTIPSADAGTDQTVSVGDTVALNGSGSNDDDGDSLSFSWSFVDRPAGSLADLSDPTAVMPTFVADVAGEYQISLTVNDGMADSAPDEVVVITAPGNTAPIADAGPDQTVQVGDLVTLDGSGSSDVDSDPLDFFWTLSSSPAGSSATLSDNTAVMPQFTADLPGDYTFELVVDDGLAGSFPDSVTVTTANTAPIADAGVNQTVALGDLVTLDGSGSSDADNDPLNFSWSLTTLPPGSGAVLASGNTSAPAFVADLAGTYVAQLVVNDGTADSAPDTVVVVTSNTQPVADAGANQTAQVGDTVFLDGTASNDADNDPLTFLWSFTSQPAGSTATFDDQTSIAPSFDADVEGTFVAQLIVNDGQQDSVPDTTTVIINVAPNTEPVANDDLATTDEDTPVTIDVLANDTDSDGDSPTVTGSTQGSNGTVAPDGSGLTYTPDADFNGTDTFTYSIDDGNGGTDNGTVTVTITPVNDDPVANDDSDETDEDTAITIDVLANDSDVDGDVLSVDSVTQGENGAVSNNNSDVTYTPDANFTGTDTFTYVVTDSNGGTATATVTVDVGGTNDDPVANDDTATTDEDTSVVVAVLDNDDDADSDALSVTTLGTPANGSVTTDGTTVTYTPDADFNGIDTFTYTADDGNGGSDTATVTVTVDSVNDDPSAVADTAVTAEDTAVTIAVLGNDSDPEGDTLTVSGITQGSNGSVTNNGGDVTYTPALNFNGVDSFSYTVSDGNGGSATANVTVTVTSVNDAPTAANDGAGTLEDTLVLIDVLANDGDVDGDSLSIASVTQGTNGGSVTSNGATVNYVPPLNFFGTDTFTYVATDGALGAQATVTVTVSPVNDAPTANAGPAQTVTLGSVVNLDGTGTDLENDPLTYAWSFTQAPGGSSAALNDATAEDPSFTPDLAGTYVLQLIASDATLSSAPASVTITVNAAGPATITLTPASAELDTRGSLTMTVTLDQPALPGGQVVDLAASNRNVTVPASVTVPQGSTTANFQADSDLDTGNVTVTASATGLASDDSLIQVQVRTFGLTSPLVGINRTVFASISLDQPAPTGGADFELSVLDTNVATVSPASLTIPAGQTQGEFSLTGGSLIGATSVTADGSDNGYESQTIDITVTDRLIDLPTSEELYFSETRSLQILIAPEAAPAGGVQIDVVSDNPSVVQVLTPVVIIPEGTFAAEALVQGSTSQSGQARITASNAAFAPDFTLIDVTAALNIIESSESFESTETELVYFQVLSGSAPIAAPSGGIEITLTSDDESCVSVTSPETIPEGESFAAATLSYGGTATLPCSAEVTAFNSIYGTDVVPVNIDEVADIGSAAVSNGASYPGLGVGLQSPGTVTLSESAHGGVVVQLQSSDPSALRLSRDAVTPGLPVIELTFPDGDTSEPYYVQGVNGATPGSVTITATSSQFSDGTLDLEVVEPALHITSLTTNTNTLAADDHFYVYTYVRSPVNDNLYTTQNVSPEDGPLTVTLTSGTPAVGVPTTLANGAVSPNTAQIAVNSYFTPGSVALGGVAFDAVGGGTTTLTASAPGFTVGNLGNANTAVDITVDQPGITVANSASYPGIGVGLQSPGTVTLGGSEHGGVTVTLTSSDPSKLRLAAGATTSGTASIDLTFADGDPSEPYYVQGVNGATPGSATITATSSQFSDGTLDLEVVEPALHITSLTTNTNTLAADDHFYVYTYVRSPVNDNLYTTQNVSPEDGPLTVTLTSGTPAVGVPTTLANGAVSPNTAQIAVNSYFTPGSVALGGVAFDAVGGGTTTLTASAPGFTVGNLGNANTAVDITVDQPGITVANSASYPGIGVGLQSPGTVTLGGSEHGGVTVTLTSSDPSKLRLAAGATTSGTASIDLTFADGDPSEPYYVQGVNGATPGSATITATSSQFSDGTLDLEVVEPALHITSLTTNTNTLAADDHFYVYTYVRSPVNDNLYTTQNVSPEDGPLTVTLTSGTPAVGVPTTLANGAVSPNTAQIAVNSYFTPGSVALGGVAFDAVGGGTTTLTASAPGFTVGNLGNANTAVDITVDQPGITVANSASYPGIGVGLQSPGTVTLGGSEHGGVTVTLTSSDPSKLRLAADATTSGTASIDLTFADGDPSEPYYVQGVNGATPGSATITATSSQFSDGSLDLEVVEPALHITQLQTNTNTLAADDHFYVYTYVRSPVNDNLYTTQNVSPEDGPLTVTLTSGTPAVGVPTTLANGAVSPNTAQIAVNSYFTPGSVALGGLAFDAQALGTTTLTASAPGFTAGNLGNAATAVDITVDQPGITVTNNASYPGVGSGLQSAGSITLGGTEHGGVTVRIASSDPGTLLIAPDATTSGTSFIEVFIADGSSSATYYVQGVSSMTGPVTITASNTSFTDGTLELNVVQPTLHITGLNTNTTAGALDDPFSVFTYVRSPVNDNLYTTQNVSASAGPLTVTLTSGTPAVGVATTLANGPVSPNMVVIPVNSYFTAGTVALGGVAFDAMSSGTTLLTASAPGFDTANAGNSQTQVIVTVNP